MHKCLRADVKATVYDLLRRSPHVGRNRPPDVKDKRESAERQRASGRDNIKRRPSEGPALARVRRVVRVAGSPIKGGRGCLPGRTARNRPTDSTDSISSRRLPQSRWPLLDGRPPCRPEETRDFSDTTITMTPRYMHPKAR